MLLYMIAQVPSVLEIHVHMVRFQKQRLVKYIDI